MRIALSILLATVIVPRTVSQKCNNNLVNKELKNRTFNDVIYEEGEYFVDNETGVERGCVCLKEICIKKCCPFGMGCDTNNNKCVSLKDQFNLRDWEGSEMKKAGYNAEERFVFDYGLINCNNTVKLLKNNNYQLKTDGKLEIVVSTVVPVKVLYNSDKYCLDNFLNSKYETVQGVMICFGNKSSYQIPLKAFYLLISSFFMILTVIVYAILPDLRNSIHGMMMIAFLLSFFVYFVSIATIHIIAIVNIGQPQCIILTFIIYFAMNAGFFWLNVMCYDVWKKFRKINVTTSSDGRSRDERNKFLWYCLYAFGMPTVLSVLLAILEFSGFEHELLPNLRSNCFLSGRRIMIYLYSPMLFTLFLNIIFIALVTIKIVQIKKQTQRLERKDKEVFKVFIKLFTLTGFTWIFEAISVSHPEYGQFLMFTDCCNIFFGLIVFIMFVCKKKIFKKIKKRCQHTMRMSVSRTEISNTNTSSFTLSRQSLNYSQNSIASFERQSIDTRLSSVSALSTTQST